MGFQLLSALVALAIELMCGKNTGREREQREWSVYAKQSEEERERTDNSSIQVNVQNVFNLVGVFWVRVWRYFIWDSIRWMAQQHVLSQYIELGVQPV